MRRLWSVALGTILAIVLTVLGAGTASAHANLISSVPADGATVPTAPAQITMNFTEPPDPTLSVVDVLGAGGNVLPGVGKPTLQPPKTLTVSLPSKLPDGVYTVSWRVASSTDGHVTAGSFAFGIGASTTVTPVGSSSSSAYGPTPLSVGAKTALYVGLMLLVAVAVVGLGAFGGDPTSLRIVGLIGAGVALVGAAGLLVAEQRAVGVPMNQLLRTATGRPYVWLLIVVLASDALAVVGAAKDRWRRVFWGAGAAAALAMWIRSANGHAAAAPTPIAQELLQWLHFLAAGVWAGGLLLLVLLLLEEARAGRTADVEPPVRAATRFSSIALIAVGFVVVTGGLRAVDELGGLGKVLDGLRTTYGWTLLAKSALVLVVIALGALNRYRSIPKLSSDPRPLRRVATIEVSTALVILILTGVLTGLDPPASANAAKSGGVAPVTDLIVTGNDFATTTRVSLTITPGFPGPNAFRASVTGYDSGAPVTADHVTLRFVSVTRPQLAATQLALKPDGGVWVGQSTSLSVSGTWQVTTLVQSGANTAEVPLTVITRSEGTTSTLVVPGQPVTATSTFPDAVRVQSFIDHSTPGANSVHMTAFAPNGTELPIANVVFVLSPASGEPIRPVVQRFSAGHFVANVTLTAGTWTIDSVAVAHDGSTYQTTYQATIG
ncbi:MAG TPA: copper resistance protein CopC [Actinomycetota bacterium]|nr:copper resistance protein CopC [Actinomycetota bacterium]